MPGARAQWYLLVDDQHVPRYPLSQVAVCQDWAAGDQAQGLGLAPVPQVVELAGALTQGREVPCQEAGGVRLFPGRVALASSTITSTFQDPLRNPSRPS